MSAYESLEDYTADVKAARDAYAADMAVQQGLCATCRRNKRDDSGRGHRECWTCRHERYPVPDLAAKRRLRDLAAKGAVA